MAQLLIPFFHFRPKGGYMQVVSGKAVEHVVTGVTVKLAKRDFLKIFGTIFLAEALVHWPTTRRMQRKVNEWAWKPRSGQESGPIKVPYTVRREEDRNA